MPRTILVVDDSSINRRILQKLLTPEYKVMEAEDGMQAIGILMREHQSVSAVLLDIIMPVMDGYGVLERMQNNPALSQIPVIVTTGDTDAEAEKRALQLGANDFVSKPFDADILKRRLDNLIKLRETSAMVNTYQRDKLTGLFNRETFFERAEKEIKRQPAGYFVLGCVDIDGFKLINDRYGIVKGDEVLRSLAQSLKDSSDGCGGITGRISADNFACLYPKQLADGGDVSPAALEAEVARRSSFAVSLSVGRYVVDDKSLTVSAMYDRAKLAQDTVKGRFDTRVAVYDESLRARLVREQEIRSQMSRALEAGQFEAWYQPQYDHSTGALTGAEALARWRHPEQGMISPAEFIPVFERTGFIYELDKYIWEDVCAHLRTWLDEGLRPLPVSVNISRYDLFRGDLVPTLLELTQRYRISEELLRLEITESAFAKSSEQVVRIVRELISHGFIVEIDDFGSGYSSLNTLKDVPAQILKLDMRFMESSDDTDRGGNILESVVRMAKWLGMSVIAEGVEKRAQADYLSSVGCSCIQGFLYARPMPAGEYERRMLSADGAERPLGLETVENLDNNAFWDPESMDTLMFNSYVGAASIFEYHNGNIELVRSNERFAETVSGGALTVADTLRLDWGRYLEEESGRVIEKQVLASMAEKREAVGEVVFTGLPGCPEKVYIRSTFRVIATAGDRCLVYNLAENITAQRLAEQSMLSSAEQLKNLSQQLRAIVANIDGGVAAMLMRADRAEYLFFNDKYCSMFGYTREQFETECPRGMLDVIYPEDNEAVNAAVRRNEAEEGVSVVEYRIRCRDGSIIWVRASGSVCHIEGYGQPVHVAVVIDITKHKRLLAMQSDEADIYRAVADSEGMAVIRYDLRSGEFHYDPSVERSLAGKYDSRGLWEILLLDMAADPADVSAMQALVHRAAKDSADTGGSLPVRLMTPSGAKKRFMVRAIRLTGEPGPADKLIITLRPEDERADTVEDRL